jgi:Ca2+-binding EF-hand superfamily protein
LLTPCLHAYRASRCAQEILDNLDSAAADFPEFSLDEIQQYRSIFMELDRDQSGPRLDSRVNV